jgi:hypothetical protein
LLILFRPKTVIIPSAFQDTEDRVIQNISCYLMYVGEKTWVRTLREEYKLQA